MKKVIAVLLVPFAALFIYVGARVPLDEEWTIIRKIDVAWTGLAYAVLAILLWRGAKNSSLWLTAGIGATMTLTAAGHYRGKPVVVLGIEFGDKR